MAPGPMGQVRSVVFAVADMSVSCAFYADVLGLALQFRDGERWAQFTAGELTIALAGGTEAPAGSAGLSLKVADMDAALATLVAGGGTVAIASINGAHEIRTAIADPDGHLLHVYAPHPAST